MKLIRAESIESTITSEQRQIKRGDTFNFLTGEYLCDSVSGDPNEVVAVVHFNQTETLKITNAQTDDGTPWQLDCNGATYQTIEITRGSYARFWDFIRCIRSITANE